MAILFFSIVVVIGCIPAVFCLDRLFAINFAKAAKIRPKLKDVFWRPRGFVGTGNKKDLVPTRRPIVQGLQWLVNTPETLASDPKATTLLRVYRLSAILIISGIVGIGAFLFII